MMRSFRRDGISLRFYDNGKKGSALVFQHGLTGDHRQILSSFLDAERRLVTLECRGHGGSEIGPEEALGIETFADDLGALLDHIGIRKAAFAGISMGAAIIANYAAKHPGRVSHLFLVRPAWFDRGCPANMLVFCAAAEYLALYGPEKGRERFMDSMAYRTLRETSPDNANSLADIFGKGDAAGLAALLRRIVTCEPGFDRQALCALPAPIRVYGAANDAVHPILLARKISEALPNSTFVELYPKSLDKARHSAELTTSIAECLFLPRKDLP